MKKFVFALLMALACIGLFSAPRLRAQDSITIKDPAEFNAYQIATSQTDPKTKASQLESFLLSYPQSVVKQAILDMLLDAYQGIGDADKTLSAASRLLQMDPNNLKAILYSVYIKNGRCARTVDQKTGLSTDPQTCDDAAILAGKGLTLTRPANIKSDDWKKLTGAAMPIFHSAIALDYMVAKKNIKAAEAEYKAELMLYTDDQSKSAGLNDTLLLAQAYSQPGAAQDLVQAVWFYARVWDFAPPQYKAKIEPELERFYKKYHGGLDGLDAIKAQAAATTFPPATFVIAPAPTAADYAHTAMATSDPSTLNLEDKEFILANGSKDDANKLWAILKDKATPVPGVVIEATTTINAIKVVLTQGGKTTDFAVNLKAPVSNPDIPAKGVDFSTQKAFILSSGVASDTDKLAALLSDDSKPTPKVVIEAVPVTVIKLAVTQDAKDAKVADFIVNVKTSLTEKEIPAAGFVYGDHTKGEAELDGIYDSYTQVPATATAAQTAQIVLRDGSIVPEKKKPVPHKPSPVHRAPAK